MNVSVFLQRPGGSVSRRLHKPGKIGKRHVVTKEEAMDYFKYEFGVTIQ